MSAPGGTEALVSRALANAGILRGGGGGKKERDRQLKDVDMGLGLGGMSIDGGSGGSGPSVNRRGGGGGHQSRSSNPYSSTHTSRTTTDPHSHHTNGGGRNKRPSLPNNSPSQHASTSNNNNNNNSTPNYHNNHTSHSNNNNNNRSREGKGKGKGRDRDRERDTNSAPPTNGSSSTTNANGSGNNNGNSSIAVGKEPEHIKVLRNWMIGRRVAEGVLDLSGMSQDPTLLEAGINPPGHSSALPQIGEVLWKIARGLDGTPIHTLSLRSSTLPNLRQLTGLPLALPRIRALDLSENPKAVEVGKDLEVLGGRYETGGKKVGGLRELEEIKLDGSIMKGKMNEKAYMREILSRFPNLLLLDGQSIPRLSFDVKVGTYPRPISTLQLNAMQSQPFLWPCEVMGGYRETPAIEGFVIDFLGKFFPLFDDNRSALIPVYAPNATVSLNAATAPSPRSRIAQYHHKFPNQTKLTWGKYLENLPRNLAKAGGHTERKIKSLVKHDSISMSAGPGEGLEKWLNKTLPGTRHPISEPDKWSFDAIDLGELNGIGRVLLTVHGQFAELPSEGLRSFSRTFILAQAPPGSSAAQAGWQQTILSDQFSVRGYTGYTAFTDSLAVAGARIYNPQPTTQPIPTLNVIPAPTMTMTMDPSQIPADILNLPGKLPQQMLVITQVQQATNLTTAMAINCADAGQYDLASSLQKFEQLKNQIPPEAFRTTL